MRNLISKEEKDRIDSICKEYYIKNYTIISDGSIDVHGSVDLSFRNLTSLPLIFSKVSGDFKCSNNELTTLEGSPSMVGDGFDCHGNRNLCSLAGGPVSVGTSFHAYHTSLSNLSGGPTTVGGSYHCYYGKLTTLVGAPKNIDGVFYCYNNQLTTLEGIPETITGGFYSEKNPLISSYSSEVDPEIRGYVSLFNDIDAKSGKIPQVFADNREHIKLILKYQRHFFIWNDDLTLNEKNFQDLICEIEEGLE